MDGHDARAGVLRKAHRTGGGLIRRRGVFRNGHRACGGVSTASSWFENIATAL